MDSLPGAKTVAVIEGWPLIGAQDSRSSTLESSLGAKSLCYAPGQGTLL